MQLIILMSALILLMFSMPQVFGHGLGEDESEALEINGNLAKLIVNITPDVLEFDIEEVEMSIMLVNDKNQNIIENVLFDLTIQDGSDNLIMQSKVFAPSGEISAIVTPIKETEIDINGKIIENVLVSSPQDKLGIVGSLFDKGGLYKIKAKILEIDSQIVSDENNEFLTLVTIGEFIPFEVNFDNRKYEVTCATYFDELRNFNFDSKEYSFSFEMNFNWDMNFIKQIPFLHAECFIPKTIDSYVFNNISTKMNGNEVFTMIDRSSENEIAIHFLFPNKDLVKMAEKTVEEDKDRIFFEIKPTSPRENNVENEMTSLTSKKDWKVYFWWEPTGDLLPNEDVTINIMFHNPETNLMIKDVTYDFEVFLDENLIDSRTNSHTFSGHDLQDFLFEQEGNARIIIDNINGVNTKAEFEFWVGKKTEKISIPDWVKNNAGWWAEGQIDDKAFASGIEFMIKQEIISVPITEKQTTESSGIPDWVKNNAGWWAEGQITDKDFASGIQFLVKSGIISV